MDLRTNATVIAQVWRDSHGRQAHPAQLLRAVDVRAVSPHDDRLAGALLGKTGTSDPIDATAVLLARPRRPHRDQRPHRHDTARISGREPTRHHHLLTNVPGSVCGGRRGSFPFVAPSSYRPQRVGFTRPVTMVDVVGVPGDDRGPLPGAGTAWAPLADAGPPRSPPSYS